MMKLETNVKLFLVFCCLFVSCTQKFYNRNGSLFRLPSEPSDRKIVHRDTFDKYVFSPEAYPIVSGTESRISYINAVTLTELIRKNEEILLIFYDPQCPATTKRLEIAKYASEKKLPYLLISLYNEPGEIRSWNDKFGIDNAYSCILPTLSKDSMGILSKKINLINSLCDSCSTIYRDELLYVDYMVFSNYGKSIYLDIEGHHNRYDDVVAWIDKVISGKPIN